MKQYGTKNINFAIAGAKSFVSHQVSMEALLGSSYGNDVRLFRRIIGRSAAAWYVLQIASAETMPQRFHCW